MCGIDGVRSKGTIKGKLIDVRCCCFDGQKDVFVLAWKCYYSF